MLGVLWSLVSAVTFSAYQITARRGMQGVGLGVGTWLLVAISLVLLVPTAQLVDPGGYGGGTITGVALFAAVGVVHFFFGWTLFGLAINTIGAARAVAVASTTPVFAAVLAGLLLGEPLNLPILAGVVLVSMGVYLVAT